MNENDFLYAIKFYASLNDDGMMSTAYGYGVAQAPINGPGKSRFVEGEIALCGNGFHACLIGNRPDVIHWGEQRATLVKIFYPVLSGRNKICGQGCQDIRMIPNWNDDTLFVAFLREFEQGEFRSLLTSWALEVIENDAPAAYEDHHWFDIRNDMYNIFTETYEDLSIAVQRALLPDYEELAAHNRKTISRLGLREEYLDR